MGYFRATEPGNLLRPAARRAILERLAAGGPETASDLARALGRRDPNVRYHLRVLMAAGLVRPVKTGPVTRYCASSGVAGARANRVPRQGAPAAAQGAGPRFTPGAASR